MSEWNANHYLKFENERTQPCVDLANRVQMMRPKTVADLGCGPGNSTAVLQSVFPGAAITGFDNSENMISKARSQYPKMNFELCSVQDITGNYDLIFSNACLQWVRDHQRLIPFLFDRLNQGGALAVQMPMNGEEPLYQIISDVVRHSEWDFGSVYFEKNDILKPDEYYDILSRCSERFDIWETVYYHKMKTHLQLIEWVRATRLHPYLEVLTDEDKLKFENEILEKAKTVYPYTENGDIIFRFRRLFFVAYK